jgi:DNA polymerase-3 subunit delta
MITTLAGSNTFVINSTAVKWAEGFKKTYGNLALERLDGEEAEFNKIQESLQSPPFLSPKKLVVLKQPGLNKEFVEKAEALIKNLPETTDLIVSEPKIDKRTSYYKFLKSKTDFKEFNELNEPKLLEWVMQYTKEMGGTINQNTAHYLIDRLGTDQYLLSNELNKLVTYQPNVSEEAIDYLTSKTAKSTVFELLDAAFRGDKQVALSIYEEQRQLKVEPQQIIAMLVWQLNILAIMAAAGSKSDSTIASEAKINPFVVQKSRRLISKLSLEQIKDFISRLTTLDRESKTLSIDTDNALKTYLLYISQSLIS